MNLEKVLDQIMGIFYAREFKCYLKAVGEWVGMKVL